MLIHPWDAALDEQEWRQWLAGTDRFGMLVVNNLDPAEAPLVVPNHFTLTGGELLLHLARPNPVWRHLEAAPQVRLVVVGDYAYIPGYWRTPAGAPLEDGVPTSYYASVQFVARPVVVDDPQGKAAILTAQLADLQPKGRAAASPRRDRRVAPTRPELIRTRSDQHPRERHRDHLTFGGTPSSSAHLSSDHRHPARQPGPLGIAEQAEGDHRDVDVAPGEGSVDGGRMGLGGAGLQIDLGDCAAQLGQLGGGLAPALGRAGGEDDAQPPADGVPPRDRQGDVGGAAEQQQGLGIANGVDHVRLLLR